MDWRERASEREREKETPTWTEFSQALVVGMFVSVVGVVGQLRSDMHLEMSKIICVNKIDLEMLCVFVHTHSRSSFSLNSSFRLHFFFRLSTSCSNPYVRLWLWHYIRNTIIQFTDFSQKDWFLFIYFLFTVYFLNQFIRSRSLTLHHSHAHPNDHSNELSAMRWIKTRKKRWKRTTREGEKKIELKRR